MKKIDLVIPSSDFKMSKLNLINFNFKAFELSILCDYVTPKLHSYKQAIFKVDKKW